jgi:hypothetical protein
MPALIKHAMCNMHIFEQRTVGMIPYVCVQREKVSLASEQPQTEGGSSTKKKSRARREPRLFSWLTDNERERCIVLPLAFSDAANIAPLSAS